MMREERKTALITGAGMGIGRGIALGLARAGYDIAIHYGSSGEGALAVQKEASETGVRAEIIQADLTSKAGVDQLFDAFEAWFGRLDLFVNNAGVTKTGDFLELTEEAVDIMCDLDLKGSYFCMQRAGKLMARQGGGHIVVISSNNAHMQTPRAAAYAAVKAGLSKLTKSAAMELAQYHIRVNAISPGWTDTGSARLAPKEDTYYKIPLKRWVLPEEIAQAVLFLDGPAALSITGAELVMDGGASLLSDRSERYGL